jgi:hypothetical protein
VAQASPLMSSLTRLNSILLLLAAILAGLAWWGEQPADTEEMPRLTPLSPGRLTRIRIERPGHKPLRLQRRNGGWWLQEPIQVRAHDFRVRALAAIAETRSHGDYPLDDPARFGLDQPMARLWLDGTEIVFGGTDSIHHRRYVAVGGRLHLIDDRFFQHIKAGPAGFASLELLPGETRIERLELPGLSLTRTAGGWSLEPEREAGADAIQQWIRDWQSAQAIWLSPYHGEARADIRIHLQGRERPVEFVILPQGVLARPRLGLQYHLGRETAARLIPDTGEAG